MNLILVKMFATALALAQVTTRPDSLKTEFDPINDQAEVVQLLKDGCAHMRKAFDIEDLNLDDPDRHRDVTIRRRVAGEIRAFRGINFDELAIAYKQFCGNGSGRDLAVRHEAGDRVLQQRRREPARPQQAQEPEASRHQHGARRQRREVRRAVRIRPPPRLGAAQRRFPNHVQHAFVAAEDKRFYQHKGIDERGLIRAFITNIAEPGRPQGGSTITQQVAKNLLVGDDVSYERKIREMIVASRIDQALSKDEILEIYLNSIYLGRGAWGIDMAAHAISRSRRPRSP